MDMPDDVASLRDFLAWGLGWHIFESWVDEEPMITQVNARKYGFSRVQVIFPEAEFVELVKALTRPDHPFTSVGLRVWEDTAGVMMEKIGMNGHGSKHFILKNCKFVHDETYGPFRPREVLLPPRDSDTKRYFQGLLPPRDSD